MIFLKIALCFIIFFVVYHFLTRKYLNPYKLYLIFGKKGSGKSTQAAMWARKYQQSGRLVFSNVDLPGVFRIDPKDIGRYHIPPESVVIIDEAGMVYDNRKFKTFPDYARDWYKLQRHRHLIVYLLSQDFDIDLKLRQLTDEMWLTRKFFRVFAVSRRIDRSIVLHKSTPDAPSGLADDLTFVPIFYPNAVKILFIPKWVKYFDSFEAPDLELRQYYTYRDNESMTHYVSRKEAVINAQAWRRRHWWHRLWVRPRRLWRRIVRRFRRVDDDVEEMFGA